jgi:hypothetical protein
MSDGLDGNFDSALIGTDWPGLIVNLANQGSTIALLVAGLTLLWLIVVALQPAPAATPLAVSPAFTPREGLSAAWLGRLAEPLTAVASGPALATAPAPLELLGANGLTPTDVLALTRLRERVQGGRVSEEATPDERLAFARWLVERGKLGE